MAQQPEPSIQEEKRMKRSGFWLNIFSKRPVYIIFNGVLIISLGILGFSMINCWVKTRNLPEMLNCMTGASYVNYTDTRAEEITPNPEDANVWVEDQKSRFELPEGKMIDEDISDLRAFWYQRYGGLIKLLVVAFLLTFLVLYEIYKYYRRRFFFNLEDETQVGYLWSIKASSEDLQLYKEKEFEEASIQIRQFGDVEDTPVPYPFLILIEKRDKDDHLAMLYDQMLLDLAKQDISVERFFFELDPRLIYKEKFKDEHHFGYLKENYPDHKLIIVGEAETFFDPVTDDWDAWTKILADWPDLMVMTPKSPLDWGHREVVLAKKYYLLPANLEAIGTVQSYLSNKKRYKLKHWVQQNEYPAPPDLESPELIQELKVYFDTFYEGLEEHYEEGRGKNIFKWLCSTAIYAELSWDMTLAIGHALEELCDEPMVTPKSLYLLSSLSWFREGKIPELARAKLIDQLDDESVTLARKTIIRLLKENEPPEGTFAYALHQLRLAVQEAQLKPNIRKHLKVVQMVQDFTLNHELTDPTVISYLNKYPKALPSISLPSNVSDAIFEKGAPALGIQSWVRMFLGAAVVLIVLLTLDPSSLDKVYSFQGRDYFLANDESWMRFHAYKGNYYMSQGMFPEAQKEYEQSLAYREFNDREDYLIAEYNLNLVKLKNGQRDEAESGFNAVSNKVDELLADNNEVVQEVVIDVKSATDYVRGKIDYESGDIEAASDNFTETLQSNTTRVSTEATYAKALIHLERGLAEKGIEQENKIRLALSKLVDVALADSAFFKQNKQAINVLDSLSNATENERLRTNIQQSLQMIRTGKMTEIPPRPVENPISPDPAKPVEKKGIVIETKFTYLTDFSEGKALVKLKEGISFADTDGRRATDSVYEDARLFEEGLAGVKKNGRWGYVNNDFELVIPHRFFNARDFQDGMASVKGRVKWGMIDKKGKIVLKFRYDRPVIFDYAGLRPEGAEPLAVIKSGGGYQFINSKGRVVFDGAIFQYARNFRGKTAKVKRWGTVFEIDREGNCLPATTKRGVCPGERWSIRKVSEFESHKKEINSASYSSNGRYLVTASKDSTAKIWSGSGKQLLASLMHKDVVLDAEFSPKSRMVATIANDNKLYIWTMEGARIKTFEESNAKLSSIAWSPDGKWLASGGKDGKVHLYNMSSMVLANVFEMQGGGVEAMCFSPNSLRIAIGGDKGGVDVWAINGKKVRSVDFSRPVLALSYAPNRPQIAIGARDSSAYIYDLPTNQTRVINGHSDWVSNIQFSPEGRYLLTASLDGRLRVWNEEGENILSVPKPGGIRSATFSPSGNSIVIAYFDPKEGPKTIIYSLGKF